MPFYSRNSARKSLIDTVAFRVASQIATVLGYIIMVRGMAKEDFGVFNLLYAFIPVVSTVASLGLEQVLLRYQPAYLSAGNRGAAAWLVRVVASSRFVTNAIVLGAVLLAWNQVAPLFKLTAYRPVFAVFCVLILLHFQVRILQLALGSHMLHRYSVGSTAILSFIKLAIYGALLWFDSLTLERAILADMAGYVVAYVVMRFAYRKHCEVGGDLTEFRPAPEERKRLIKHGLLNNFNDAGVLLIYSTMDNFFIAAFIDTVSVGIYAFYSRLNGMIVNLLPAKLFDNIIQPLFFATPSTDAARKIPQYFSFLINMNLLVQWPVLAFASAYHEQIVQVVFGGKFIEHSWLLPIILGFGTFNAIADPAGLVAQYEEKPGILLLSKLFAVYNIAAMAVLVPHMGIYGAALASGTAQAMKNVFVWWHVRYRAVWINARVGLLSGIGVWGAGVAACYGVKRLIDMPGLLHLGVGVVIFAATALVYLRTDAISTFDRSLLASVVGGKTAQFLRRLGLLPSGNNSAAAGG